MMPLRRLVFLLLTFAQTAVINSTFAIVAPFFPIFAVDAGIPKTGVALVFGAFAVAQLAMAPCAGGLASGFGRRKVLTVGVAGVALSTLCMGFAADLFDGDPSGMVQAMVALRVVQGAGAAMATTTIFAILTDSFPKHKGAVIGAANACDGAGWAIGPPVGGFLYVLGGVRLPFLVVGPLPVVLLLAQLMVFPTAAPPSPSAAAASVYADGAAPSKPEASEPDRIGAREVARRAQALTSAPLLMTMFAGTIFTSKWGMFDVTFTPWAMNEFGFSVEEVSVYFSIPA